MRKSEGLEISSCWAGNSRLQDKTQKSKRLDLSTVNTILSTEK
jgi:hypothetical protein